MSVKVRDSFCGTYENELGVPQGLVVWPLLCVPLINDLPRHIADEL